MLNWYNHLYVGDNAKRNAKQIVRKLNSQQMVIGVYLITLASNEKNQLDIISAYNLIQPIVYRMCPMVVGIAMGYEEAVELVAAITSETMQETGNTDIRNYLLQR